MVMFPEWYGGIKNDDAIRIAFLLVGLWWFGFAQITFLYLPENNLAKNQKSHYLLNGYKELKVVLKDLKNTPRLKRFLLSFFFYNMGVQTVMYVATLFGEDELKLNTEILIAIILIIQFVAIGGAILFSSFSGRYGNLRAITTILSIWIAVCIGAYFCNKEYGINEQNMFIGLAACVGLVMGGIQSMSRSTYSKLLPDTKDHASYFSFYDVCDKVGTVLGTFAFGYINELTGSMRNSILLLASFFVIGIVLLLRVGKQPVLAGTIDKA
jgi:UMF1 family MFS transporter